MTFENSMLYCTYNESMQTIDVITASGSGRSYYGKCR